MRKTKGWKIDTIFAMVNFTVFTASMLLALLFGADVYNTITKNSQVSYDEKSRLSYIWTKVKSNDAAGMVYAGEFCGLSALCLEEEYGYTTYKTIIYLYDGWVRELFCEAGLEFSPEDGMSIVEAETLTFEQLDNGLIMACIDSENLFIYPRGKEVHQNKP